jgi:hypothetical protein
MRTEAKVYLFTWHISFDGDAVVRIGREGDEMTLRWVYRWYRVKGDERSVVPLTMADGARLLDSLIAADGSDWLIEGRLKVIYQAASRWSPRGALFDVDRPFFRAGWPALGDARSSKKGASSGIGARVHSVALDTGPVVAAPWNFRPRHRRLPSTA